MFKKLNRKGFNYFRLNLPVQQKKLTDMKLLKSTLYILKKILTFKPNQNEQTTTTSVTFSLHPLDLSYFFYVKPNPLVKARN